MAHPPVRIHHEGRHRTALERVRQPRAGAVEGIRPLPDFTLERVAIALQGTLHRRAVGDVVAAQHGTGDVPFVPQWCQLQFERALPRGDTDVQRQALQLAAEDPAQRDFELRHRRFIEDAGERLPGDRLRGAIECPREGRVGHLDHACRVDAGQQFARRLHHRAHVLGLALRQHALGRVAQHHDAGRPITAADLARRRSVDPQAAVARQRHRHLIAGPPFGKRAVDDLQQRTHAIGRQDFAQHATDHLVSRTGKQIVTAALDVEDAPELVELEQQVGQGMERGFEIGGKAHRGALGFELFGHVDARRHATADSSMFAAQGAESPVDHMRATVGAGQRDAGRCAFPAFGQCLERTVQRPPGRARFGREAREQRTAENRRFVSPEEFATEAIDHRHVAIAVEGEQQVGQGIERALSEISFVAQTGVHADLSAEVAEDDDRLAPTVELQGRYAQRHRQFLAIRPERPELALEAHRLIERKARRTHELLALEDVGGTMAQRYQALDRHADEFARMPFQQLVCLIVGVFDAAVLTDDQDALGRGHEQLAHAQLTVAQRGRLPIHQIPDLPSAAGDDPGQCGHRGRQQQRGCEQPAITRRPRDGGHPADIDTDFQGPARELQAIGGQTDSVAGGLACDPSDIDSRVAVGDVGDGCAERRIDDEIIEQHGRLDQGQQQLLRCAAPHRDEHQIADVRTTLHQTQGRRGNRTHFRQCRAERRRTLRLAGQIEPERRFVADQRMDSAHREIALAYARGDQAVRRDFADRVRPADNRAEFGLERFALVVTDLRNPFEHLDLRRTGNDCRCEGLEDTAVGEIDELRHHVQFAQLIVGGSNPGGDGRQQVFGGVLPALEPALRFAIETQPHQGGGQAQADGGNHRRELQRPRLSGQAHLLANGLPERRPTGFAAGFCVPLPPRVSVSGLRRSGGRI